MDDQEIRLSAVELVLRELMQELKYRKVLDADSVKRIVAKAVGDKDRDPLDGIRRTGAGPKAIAEHIPVLMQGVIPGSPPEPPPRLPRADRAISERDDRKGTAPRPKGGKR